MTLIFAHRGASGTYPENTMLAFHEAERVKADGIELDVQLTKDGEIVIIHDDKVDRTTDGKGYVKDFTLKQIKKFNAAANFDKGKYKEPIPTLEEFLLWFKETEMICNIELKTTTITNQDLEDKVIALINKYQLEERIIISSFNHYSIVYCYRIAPNIETAPLYMEGLYMPWVYAQSIKAKAIHPYHKVTPDELVTLAQQNGIHVRPFTVNKKHDMKRFLKVKANAIITDYPEIALKLRD
ncbi:glycerophosphodiester phosphodiesterase [Bacillus kwashiorkori]|uniref:glycerophosphodiester phosphodiesterase n=1 Tax=Bacillus kwashiorkori TaxID=1522318 RepID=UPI000783DBD6|nr:glycerophosphodiester phosphodiesterase [Bacillus kwashiorkori]